MSGGAVWPRACGAGDSPACVFNLCGKLDGMFRRIVPALFLVLIVANAVPMRAAGKPNIVLITLSSTRADRMGFLGSKARLTPNLDGLARQSMVFEHAYSQAPLTVVSHATILTGTYPQTHRVSEFGSRLASTLPFVPDLLRAGGYRTGAFVGSIALDPKNGLAPGFDRGFSVYNAGFQPPEHSPGRNGSVDRSAAQVAARAAAWLARNPKGPFLLWVHLNDPEAASRASYNAAVASADAAAGKVIAVLRARKLYDDALVLVASDHGQGLGEHGEETHGVFLYDETIHVPLLLKLPQNQSAGKRVAARASLVDVAPTVLEVAGVPVPAQMQGQSLLRIARTNSDQASYSVSDFPQRAFGWSALESWRAGKYLYIKAPRPELYDLSADPGATRNLAQTSKATLETIAGQLDAFDRRFRGPSASAGPELTSSEMQKLASLGYVGVQKSAGPSAAATGVDPKDGIADANKVLAALALLNEGKPEKAAAILQPVLATGSKMYLAQFVMGAALARQQQFPKAIEYLRHAIGLQPDSTWAHYEMGASLLKSGDYKTAVVHLEIASSRLPGFVETHALLAQAYDHLGRAEEAKRERSQSGASPKP
jgi:arylsulfatase A-like enzyme/Tfp pilus assembly protein PilF